MFSKKKYPIICLLEIPVEFFIYVILLGVGAELDHFLFGTNVESESEFPFFFAVVFVIATVLLLAAVIASVVNFIRYTVSKRDKRKRQEKAGTEREKADAAQ